MVVATSASIVGRRAESQLQAERLTRLFRSVGYRNTECKGDRDARRGGAGGGTQQVVEGQLRGPVRFRIGLHRLVRLRGHGCVHELGHLDFVPQYLDGGKESG